MQSQRAPAPPLARTWTVPMGGGEARFFGGFRLASIEQKLGWFRAGVLPPGDNENMADLGEMCLRAARPKVPLAVVAGLPSVEKRALADSLALVESAWDEFTASIEAPLASCSSPRQS